MTLFKALTGGAFDHLNWEYSWEFDQNISKKLNAPEFGRERGGMGGFGIERYITRRSVFILEGYSFFFIAGHKSRDSK